MNIQEAKQEIKRTLRAYTRKKPDGSGYQIPVEKQRPILLIGPPGIGKTAIMAQIAKEEQVGLVAYTMTHHTRQSAIGLPVLREKEYDGKLFSVTEYTMSEIVASIYDAMETTGQKTGILFLDEINCVSETLAPVMLQLLQNKTFGSHPIPSGWLIVGAGNPPEYNKSVREMDMVTLDRVKYMNIEADLEIWRSYAAVSSIHGSVLTFLTVYPHSFYQTEQTKLERSFVTARGWEDLSCILYVYEEMGEAVTEHLISQYVHSAAIAREFFLFYELFHHYEREYRENYPAASHKNRQRLKTAGAGECMAVAAVLAAQVTDRADAWAQDDRLTGQICQGTEAFLRRRTCCQSQDIEQEIDRRQKALRVKEEHDLAKLEEVLEEEALLRFLEEWKQDLERAHGRKMQTAQDIRESRLKIRIRLQENLTAQIGEQIQEAYKLLDSAAVGAAKQYFTAALTRHPACSRFLTEHPQEAFSQQSRELLLSRREEELRQQVEGMIEKS